MVEQGKPNQPLDLSRRYTWVLATAWTTAVAAALGFSVCQEYQATHALALGRAQVALEKDVAYRRWMTQQGGVYVWVTSRTQPSEHLRGLPKRDVDRGAN